MEKLIRDLRCHAGKQDGLVLITVIHGTLYQYAAGRKMLFALITNMF
jgi:hypothetical protein